MINKKFWSGYKLCKNYPIIYKITNIADLHFTDQYKTLYIIKYNKNIGYILNNIYYKILKKDIYFIYDIIILLQGHPSDMVSNLLTWAKVNGFDISKLLKTFMRKRQNVDSRIYILMWIYNNNYKRIRDCDIILVDNVNLIKWLLGYDNYILKNKRGKYNFNVINSSIFLDLINTS